MAKREQFFRLMLIAEFFKRKPKGVNFKEIENFLERKFEEKGWLNKLSFSEVTFKRERKDEILQVQDKKNVYEINLKKEAIS